MLGSSSPPGLLTVVSLAALCGGVLLLGSFAFRQLRAGEVTVRHNHKRRVGAGGFAHRGESSGEILGDPSVNSRARRIYTPLDSQHDMYRYVFYSESSSADSFVCGITPFWRWLSFAGL